MADVKWIKLATDLFEDEKILLLETLPDCDAIIGIWIRLLCFAGKQNNGGVFLMNGRLSYTDEMLAAIFRKPLGTVRLALEAFRKYGMIEVMDGTVTIPNWGKHQSLDAYEKKKTRDKMYQANRRITQQALLGEKSSDNRLTTDDSSSDVAVSEREKEKEREEEREEDTASLPAAPAEAACPFGKIMELYHERCVSFPRIRSIDGERRKAVSARWRGCRSLETFEELFRLAEASAFLKGENDRNWHADFDWMMKAANFSKVLERKYDGKSPRSPNDFSDASGYENMKPL